MTDVAMTYLMEYAHLDSTIKHTTKNEVTLFWNLYC